MSTKGRKRRREEYGRDDAVSALPSIIGGWLPVIAALLVVVGAGLWFGGFIPTGSGGGDGGSPSSVRAAGASSNQALPSFITGAPTEVQEAYAFVAAHTSETQYIPCYCGCGEHSGHRWVRDCFVEDWSQSGITYDPHGSGCDVCVNIALDVKSGLESGQSLSAIRKAVDTKYSSIGPGTDTPLPPS